MPPVPQHDPQEQPKPKPGEWVKDRVYCLHCALDPASESRFMGEYGARDHVLKEHDIPKDAAKMGVDYAETWQARLIWKRRSAKAQEEAFRAARRLLDPNYTVEDFLTDAGDVPWDLTGGLTFEDDE